MKKPIKHMKKIELISEISRLNDEVRAAKNAKRAAQESRDKALTSIQAAAQRFALTDIPNTEIRGVARRLFGSLACDDLEMASRVLGSWNVVGMCKLCKINLYGDRERPSRKAMSCGITGCPFGRWQKAEATVAVWR